MPWLWRASSPSDITQLPPLELSRHITQASSRTFSVSLCCPSISCLLKHHPSVWVNCLATRTRLVLFSPLHKYTCEFVNVFVNHTRSVQVRIRLSTKNCRSQQTNKQNNRIHQPSCSHLVAKIIKCNTRIKAPFFKGSARTRN